MNPKLVEFEAAMKAYQDGINSSIDGIVADSAAQDVLIAELQASQGDVWTPEDQALLDRIQAGQKAISDRVVLLDEQRSAAPTTPVTEA